jgi:hypothetical protein
MESREANVMDADNNYINLFWCYYGNLGDALSPYIVSGLSGLRVRYNNFKNPDYLHEFYLLCRNHIKYDFNRLMPYNPLKKTVMAIGSILNCARPNYYVWGSGYMTEFQHSEGGEFLAVRGELSAQKLYDDGFPYCSTWGDPALLLPLLYRPEMSKKYLIGMIPHHCDNNDLQNKFKGRAKIISIMTGKKRSIITVIDEICSCEYIISSSLHGLIVAHAYNIPAIWIKNNEIVGTFKFYDYFSSVGISQYTGFAEIDKILENPRGFFLKNREKSTIVKEITGIQRGLLMAAPFTILDKFKL